MKGKASGALRECKFRDQTPSLQEGGLEETVREPGGVSSLWESLHSEGKQRLSLGTHQGRLRTLKHSRLTQSGSHSSEGLYVTLSLTFSESRLEEFTHKKIQDKASSLEEGGRRETGRHLLGTPEVADSLTETTQV